MLLRHWASGGCPQLQAAADDYAQLLCNLRLCVADAVAGTCASVSQAATGWGQADCRDRRGAASSVGSTSRAATASELAPTKVL